mmetsp:Transcript_4820/g.11252  ORF Transcript_4820/g.11252 Transcript_4820/m.11252 type:complete len:108 (-) Transcript_4820:119-442(-)
MDKTRATASAPTLTAVLAAPTEKLGMDAFVVTELAWHADLCLKSPRISGEQDPTVTSGSPASGSDSAGSSPNITTPSPERPVSPFPAFEEQKNFVTDGGYAGFPALI